MSNSFPQNIKNFICLFVCLFLITSCHKEEKPLSDSDNIKLLKLDLEKQTNNTSLKNLNYQIDWQNIKKVKDEYFIPIINSNIYSKTPSSEEYSLSDKIWLVAVKNSETTNFKLITLYPDNLEDYKTSGTIISEEWNTGAISHNFYSIENKTTKNNLDFEKLAVNKIAKEMLVKKCVKKWIKVCVETADGCQGGTWREVESCDYVFVDVGDDYPPLTGGGGDGSGSGSGSGNGTENGNSDITSINILISGPKINPKEENKCFNLSQPAKVTIYVQQGKEGSRDLVGPNEVGHVFVGIQQNGIERYYGFYPESGANGAMVAVGKNYNSELRDNSSKMYHVSISTTVTASQLNKIITYANNPPPIYNVNDYACTDFGIAIGNLAGMNLPSTKTTKVIFSGTSPGNLGEDIRTGNFPNKTTNRAIAPS